MNKEIKALERKIEKLIKEFDKGKKATVTKKAATKPARLKTTKKAPEKKAPAKKETTKLTATDQVVKIINSSKKGVDAAALFKKTGFDDKKIRNILFRAYKMGKIKRAGKGVYVGP